MSLKSILHIFARKNEADQLEEIFPHFEKVSEFNQSKLKKLAKTLLARNFKVSTREAALICRLSHRAFEEKFQELSGYSYHQFVTRLKVFRSKTMLNKKVSTEEIVKQLNFKNIDHFNTCFQRVIGKKPDSFQMKKTS